MSRRRQSWEIHVVHMDDRRAECSCGWSYEGERPGIPVRDHSVMNGGATVHNSVPHQNRGTK
jgi:hypothetical protein